MLLRKILILCVVISMIKCRETELSSVNVKKTSMVHDDPNFETNSLNIKTNSREEWRQVYIGGCANMPKAPINGNIRCSMDSGCIATCASNYIFPNGVHQLAITCSEGMWHIHGTDWNSIPHCEPICLPECQNNGICIAPHQCDCPKSYTGSQCQFENKPCLNYPPPVLNSYRQCSSKSCTISCKKNFVFPDGSAIANLICKNGNWQPVRTELVTIPDCEPVCTPPCKNGGNCLPGNVCQCPQEYRGEQCQFPLDACTAEKMQFNGGFHCTSNRETYSCTLHCPLGANFEFPPAAVYICTYDKGYFEPQPIPQCKFDQDVHIVSLNTTYNTYMESTNHSWSTEDIFKSNLESFGQNHISFNPNNHYKTHDIILSTKDSAFSSGNDNRLVIERKQKESKTCYIWGRTHYKTFDGKIFSFASKCSHVLIQDEQDNIFTIAAEENSNCGSKALCSMQINIFFQRKEYTLLKSENNILEFHTQKKLLPIPIQLPGLHVQMSGHFIVFTLDAVGVNMKWDGDLFLQIEASETMWNKTEGLCGKMNGDSSDDLITKNGFYPQSITTLMASWQIENIGEKCDENPAAEHVCSQTELAFDATEFCTSVLSDYRFYACANTINLSELRETCIWEYCTCNYDDKRKCACNSMNVYVKQCSDKGIVSYAGWRNNETCPMECDNDKVYMSCGPKIQQSCGINVEIKASSTDCEEGCFCPEGLVMHENKCISQKDCPCRLRGRFFSAGSTVSKECNSCTCMAGKWLCTQERCSARCAVIGDPHYTTFDGKRYDFMGQCKYYLMKGNNYSIQAENVACLGAISENMGFVPINAPSCTKAITIKMPDTFIKLKQNRQIILNGEDVVKLPLAYAGIKLRSASNIFIVIHLPNGLEIWWDGISRVYINAPADLYDKTSGLCGTFTTNQKDDFITPDGDIEKTAISFANKWKTNEQCIDISDTEVKHPCDINPQKRFPAEQHCSMLYGNIFSDCHWHVDPKQFYKDCLFDMCSCETDVKSCLCPMLAAYAKDCAMRGIHILWRHSVDECSMHCTGGQLYDICGNSCTRSCEDISFDPNCKQECVEGCNCPEGETLDINGECIPIGQCPCKHAGYEFKAGHKEARPGNKAQELCTCTGGTWNCRHASVEEIELYPSVKNLMGTCSLSENQEITDCMPIEPRTCHNMHNQVTNTPAVCKSGCVCKVGYVLDISSGKCIKKENCPCHHGGKSYSQNSTIQDDCNTCLCINGKWNCSDIVCAGVCHVWGDSHYKTFDGKLFDFQGACDYILVKSSISKEESFDVSIQNVPCGTTGVTCTKSITLTIADNGNQETISLIRGKPLLTPPLQRIVIREAGLFLYLVVPDMGLVLQWDKGTRVYIKLDPKWMGHTKGLCGDYNNNSEDDFKTPSGGISEVSANLFGNSWKKNPQCLEPENIKNPCEQHPERKFWAIQKCGILKSPIFSQCHSEVEVEPYLEKCIFDSCACDSGGDCDCLCTGLAVYSHECNVKDIPIQWRHQELCPMQCDESCTTYSPCISTCPHETCDSIITNKHSSLLCREDTCVEGCLYKECAEGYVYWNTSYTDCVPKTMCKPFCTEINGTLFYEGDKVNSDGCQTCYCSRGKIICNGMPCTTLGPTKSVTIPLEEAQKCIDGWSVWINRNVLSKEKMLPDIEPLPTLSNLISVQGSGVCNQNSMVDIKCRSVEGHLTPKQTDLNVECSLERGLYCDPDLNFPCMDFEISVLCRCTLPTTEVVETVTGPNGNVSKEIQYKCDVLHQRSVHLSNCHLFYECVSENAIITLVERSCGPDLYYNPKTFTCEEPSIVIAIRPECSMLYAMSGTIRWMNNTNVLLNDTLSTINRTISTTKLCKDNEVWNSCAIKCTKTCQYYHYSLSQHGYCVEENDCIAGCTPKDVPTCPTDKLWRDFSTCIDTLGCTCKSHNGTSVKPGSIVKESECELCQCINNYYTCDNTLCSTITNSIEHSTTASNVLIDHSEDVGAPSSSITTSITTSIIIIPSTVTPPVYCTSENFVSLIEHFSPNKISFDASSSKSYIFQPENSPLTSKLSNRSAGSWEPGVINTNQWLDIRFRNPEPVYGIILQGDAMEDKYVTSYKILYSENGHTFTYILNHQKQPRTFHGPIDAIKPVEQKFYEPIEAKIIRINPQTWHNGIAIRVDLLGCEEYVTPNTEKYEQLVNATNSPELTPIFSEKLVTPVCNDTMGLDDNLMSAEQVSVSSALTDVLPNLRLSSLHAWRPKWDNLNQYVQFDFLDPRNITGIMTKGDDKMWTTTYKVFYSIDSRKWNSFMDNNGAEKEFLANFDAHTISMNYFERPLFARYLRVQPTKWHKHIALKTEVIGCILPYPTVPESTVQADLTTTERSSVSSYKCNVCKGIVISNTEHCSCDDLYWWNGASCVHKQECPCVVGHVSYAVGSVYETDDCQHCICTLDGMAVCSLKKCEPCIEKEMQTELTESCTCICKPCASNTRLCPTSDICINQTLWCDGIQHCPDDEINCPQKSTTILPNIDFTYSSTTASLEGITTKCHVPTCPHGYHTVLKHSLHYNINRHSKTNINVKHSVKGHFRKHFSHDYWSTHTATMQQDALECPQFTCVPDKPSPVLNQENVEICPEASCPPDYTLIYEKMSMYKLKKCPKYICQPPQLQEVVCNIGGRTFTTFDGTEYKYDICNHLLARDMFDNKWYIAMEKQCNLHKTTCNKVLVITIKNDIIVLHSDMHFEINDYTFTASQVGHLQDNSGLFKLSHVGDTIYFISKYYGLWIIWDSNENVKIGVTTALVRQIDGLCGYFDGYKMNDKQMPDGNQAINTIQFGNSWAIENAPECKAQVCIHEDQEKSWEICNIIKNEIFKACANALDIDKYYSQCLETVCSCLHNNYTLDNCRCRLLTSFVTECQAVNSNIDLSDWRRIHDCPVNCPTPLIHKDCFRYKCETTCFNLQEIEPCPLIEGVCFAGCFCPEGTVRNGHRCIPATECKDCSCDVFRNSEFVTFDRKNIKFSGNCTYILSRDIEAITHNLTAHTYQILVTNIGCETETCTEVITLLYQQHIVQIEQIINSHELEIMINAVRIDNLPYKLPWLTLAEQQKGDIILILPEIQLEIVIFKHNFAFTIKLPSHIYGDRLEGLCGNCNGDYTDDLRKANREITSDISLFAESWQVTDLPVGLNLSNVNCINKEQKECATPVPEHDPCQQLLSLVAFGQCHILLDPKPYLDACHNTLCAGNDYCDSLAAYARQCLNMGLCPDWRTENICPYNCSLPYMNYHPCESNCERTCADIGKQNNAKCLLNSIEGCYCPEDYVLHNNTCVPKANCLACDEEGHMESDIWYPDKCTECSCNRQMIKCEKKECPIHETICEENMKLSPISATENDCCPKYFCVPDVPETTLCSEAQQPECGFGQLMKSSVDVNGCQKFICQCIPAEECSLLENTTYEIEELKPGIVEIINTTGCCPRSTLVCKPEACSSAPKCPQYYKISVTEESNSCCPVYKCELPKDVCLFTSILHNDVEAESITTLKKIGEKWNDGKCKTCECENSQEGPMTTCSMTECPSIDQHVDAIAFVLKEVYSESSCCPQFERIACIDGNRTYNVNETWQPNMENVCVTMLCNRDSNGIQKVVKSQDCNVLCEPGYEYQPSSDKSKTCCGKCIPVACVMGDELKYTGEEWFSDNFCTKYSCQFTNGSLTIRETTDSCAEMNIMEEYEYVVEKHVPTGQCCPEIVRVGCRHNGNVYKPGDKWKSINNSCISEKCVLGPTGIIKQEEIETCPKNCLPGWIYHEPQNNECCGNCEEAFCVANNILYRPGETWLSNDNCTTFTCFKHSNQISISSSSVVCPDIRGCPFELIYTDHCCKLCNLTSFSQKLGACSANVLEAEHTIGILTEHHSIHGMCRNLLPIKGITECHGICESSTYFDTERWTQSNNCQCCQPTDYKALVVELTCEDGNKVRRQLVVPEACTCQLCSSADINESEKKEILF